MSFCYDLFVFCHFDINNNLYYITDINMPSNKVKCSYGPTNSYVVSTPIGDVQVVSCPKGLHSVSQIGDTDEYFSPDIRYQLTMLPVVVHWLSETLTNQSDISILCDSYTLWSILIHSVEKNICLTLFFVFVFILTKILQFIPVFFWHSVNRHIWTSLLFVYCLD